MHLILCSLQSAINIGMILRTAEVYRHPVIVIDRHGVFMDEAKLRTIGDFACGALERQPPLMVPDLEAAFAATPGRRLATSIAAPAAKAHEFGWRADDAVLFGNEYDGLSATEFAAADALVTIPMPAGYLPKPKSHSPIDPARAAGVSQDGAPNLNTAVAASIIAFLGYVAGA